MSSNGFFPLEGIVHIDPDHFKGVMTEWDGYVEKGRENENIQAGAGLLLLPVPPPVPVPVPVLLILLLCLFFFFRGGAGPPVFHRIPIPITRPRAG